MTRKFLWTGLAVILSAALPWYASVVRAQSSSGSGETAGENEANPSQAGQSDSTTAGSEATDTTQDQSSGGQADAQSTTDAQAGGTAQAPASDAADAAANDPSRTDAAQPGQAVTPPAPGASGGATQNRDQSLLTDPSTRPLDPSAAALRGASPEQGQAQQQQRDLLAGIEFGQATIDGLTVSSLGPGTIFFNSGLRPGDVIVSYDGQPIRTHADLMRWVFYRPGERVPMTVLRGGRQETIYISYPEDSGYRSGEYQVNRPVDAAAAGGPGFLGVGFDAQIFDAALVRDVLPGSSAEQAGLREGDVIVAINGRAVSSFQEAMSLIRSMRAGDSLEIEYTRRVADRTQAVLGARPEAGPRAPDYPANEEVRGYRGVAPIDAPAESPVLPPPSLEGERDLP